MEFKIKPFLLTQTATQLHANVINTTDREITVYYELKREDGRVIETGNKIFPIEALAIVSQRPINVAGLNQLLAAWDLEAEDEQV